MKLFDPILEYRIFIQSKRTKEETTAFLSAAATKGKTTPAKILLGYANGDDILDPDIFFREDIEEFARAHGLEHDRQVIMAINKARPEKEYHLLHRN